MNTTEHTLRIWYAEHSDQVITLEHDVHGWHVVACAAHDEEDVMLVCTVHTARAALWLVRELTGEEVQAWSELWNKERCWRRR